MAIAETCPIINGTPETDTVIDGSEEPFYIITPTDEDFCNPASLNLIYYNGLAAYNGQFLYGGA